MSRREPSRKRSRRTDLSWDDVGVLFGEAELMDGVLRREGYDRAPSIKRWVRANGVVAYRYVWRQRRLGVAVSLTVSSDIRLYAARAREALALRPAATA